MSKSERTRQFIIEQSATLFNTRGLAGTAMSDVMEVTKMAKGGLYGHFESKEALSLAVVDYNLKKLVASVDRAIAAEETFKSKLIAFIEVFRNPLHFPVEGGCPLLNFGTEADDTNQAVKNKLKTVIEMAQKKCQTLIQQGIKSGEFKKTFDAREFSIIMLSLMEGGTLIGRVLHTNSQMTVIQKMLKREIEANSN
jgi:TetR/AcrR family transcriptional regulator, transcriptional repressor for nem operon